MAKTKSDYNYLTDNGPSPVLPVDATPFDHEDPRSVANLVPEEMREVVLNLPIKFFRYNETQLKKFCKPDAELCRLRLSFWDEYTVAQDNNRKMKIEEIVKGVCLKTYFYQVIVPDKLKIGFIMIPPKDYMIAQREMHELAWDQMRKVLSLNFVTQVPMKDNKGLLLYDNDNQLVMQRKVDHSLIAKMIDITKMLDLRVKGAIVQKMQLQTQAHITTHNSPVQSAISNAGMENLMAMEEKIIGIKKELEQLDAAKDTSAQEPIIDAEEISP